MREQRVGLTRDPRMQEDRVEHADDRCLDEDRQKTGEGRGVLITVELQRLALQPSGILAEALLQFAQPGGEPSASLLSSGLRDSDRDERCPHEQRNEDDGDSRGGRPGDRLEKGDQAHQARVREVEDGGDGRDGEEVHSVIRSWGVIRGSDRPRRDAATQRTPSRCAARRSRLRGRGRETRRTRARVARGIRIALRERRGNVDGANGMRARNDSPQWAQRARGWPTRSRPPRGARPSAPGRSTGAEIGGRGESECRQDELQTGDERLEHDVLPLLIRGLPRYTDASDRTPQGLPAPPRHAYDGRTPRAIRKECDGPSPSGRRRPGCLGSARRAAEADRRDPG